ncbi:ABC transporter, permease protein 1 (cluster 1, maltose/g3p/polyamine/iron) [hydrothermal vent metagenome]|uniref:ABC transporter, permease protein 1 (Cluster 1, maltose/g3p/polyamine/iron) n=1 Tax=hydrothermal vent metagenome TaxID=652676 RepID=A0A3B0T7R7_9ZZZZ
MHLKYKLVAPLVVVLSAVMIYPLAFSAWISVHDYRLTRLNDVKFRGADNFVFVITDPQFITAMSNTLLFVFGAVTMELVLGLGLAILVKKLFRFENFIRSVLLAPMFITPIAVGLMFRFLLNSQLGVIPYYLAKTGVEVDWFGPNLALFSIMLIDTWQWTPFMFLMFLAGLESLPKSPFEAARVDGAGPWLTFWSLTLPMLRPVIVVALIIRALDAFKVFEYVYAITRGGPGDVTETIMFYIYKTGFRFFRMGQAAAAAFILIAVILALVIVLFWATKSDRRVD